MAASPARRKWLTVSALGLAQMLAYASSYYLPAILAVPMARDLGVAPAAVFAGFSLALVVSALLGPLAGRWIDRWGGRPLLLGANLIFALGLAGLSIARGPGGLYAAWALIGIAMGSGLYEAAFAALVRLYGYEARRPITGITMIAGLASTVGWPLTTLLEHLLGWRGACLAWAGLHLALGLPLNASLPRFTAQADAQEPPGPLPARAPPGPTTAAPPLRAAMLLTFVFAATMFISTAMVAQLPRLLRTAGATAGAAVTIGALVGPAQLLGRIMEFSLIGRINPLVSARMAALAHPVGAAILLVFGAPSAAIFTILHGAGNGILTVSKGVLPLVLFGSSGYGARQGQIVFPARIAEACAPWLFGLCLDQWGASALWVSMGLGLATCAALLALRRSG
jgi:predicted MFS family arabinose efflux permease